MQSTLAPLVYVTSAVLFFLGLTALARVRSARRAPALIGAGLGLALIGFVLEQGGFGKGGVAAVLALLLGGAGGAALALALPRVPVPARLALVPALAGGSVALAAIEILLAGAVPLLGGVAAGVALLLGLGAAVGAALSAVRRETARSTAGAAVLAAVAGWGVAALGLALSNAILLVIGSVAGAAGLTLARVVARTAGQALFALLGGARSAAEARGYRFVRSCGSQEAALVLENAQRVVVVPGFGMAAAQAQHALKEMSELLEKRGTEVTWVIHPAAGCVPGHMNIVLDEADVHHDRVIDLGRAAEVIARADAALVVGANDVVNPAAMKDPGSPVYGMEVPDLSAVRSVLVVKRTLGPGSSGVPNALFEQPNSTLVFGDAKKVAQSLVAELKGGAAH